VPVSGDIQNGAGPLVGLQYADGYMSDLRVSTSEFMRNFSAISERALVEPVTITENGRDRLVVLSMEEYQRLKRGERHVYRTEQLPAELVKEIAVALPDPGAVLFDHEINDKDR